MKSVAIITKNNLLFDDMEQYVMPLICNNLTKETRTELKKSLNDYIWSVIGKFVTFMDVIDEDHFYEIIAAESQRNFPDHNPSECVYFTGQSYSTPKRFYEILHWKPSWDDYQNSIKDPRVINNFGCLMSLDHSVIENSCIMISNEYDLTASKYVKMGSTTKEDIIRIIRRRYFHTAILIENNRLTKYYYQNIRYLVNMLFGDGGPEIDHVSFTHLKYNLVYYFKKNATQYVNQIATRINGSYRFYGKVLVLHEMDDDIYANLGIKEIKRLNTLSYGSSKNRELDETEMFTIPEYGVREDGTEQTEKVPFWSKYIVIENRMKHSRKDNKCIQCSSTDNLLTCDRCFKVKYCSDECREAYAINHKGECL